MEILLLLFLFISRKMENFDVFFFLQFLLLLFSLSKTFRHDKRVYLGALKYIPHAILKVMKFNSFSIRAHACVLSCFCVEIVVTSQFHSCAAVGEHADAVGRGARCASSLSRHWRHHICQWNSVGLWADLFSSGLSKIKKSNKKTFFFFFLVVFGDLCLK